MIFSAVKKCMARKKYYSVTFDVLQRDIFPPLFTTAG